MQEPRRSLHFRNPKTLHWLVAIPLIIGGIWLSDYLDKIYFDLPDRYKAYQFLQKSISREIHVRRVTLVEIGDNEFWKGELDRRIPIKRDYLARLIRTLDLANPTVIALDYNLRSPVPDGSIVETPIYKNETQKLIDAAEEVAKNRPVVLPASFNEQEYYEEEGSYSIASSVYNNHRFVNPVVAGYINLLHDKRHVPITWKIHGWREPLQSFSLSIARIVDPKIKFNQEPGRQDQFVLLGRFLKEEEFPRVAAEDVIAAPAGAWRAKVYGRVVIIGSFYRKDAFGLGDYVDQFLTPAGAIPGAVVHANYVEAWTDSRVIQAMPRWLNNGLDAIISLAVSWLFVSNSGQFWKFSFVLCAVILTSYICLVNLSLFFDPYLPLAFVVLHGCAEKMIQWKERARQGDYVISQ
jgi:CHASE2 domain-containing sensor protein